MLWSNRRNIRTPPVLRKHDDARRDGTKRLPTQLQSSKPPLTFRRHPRQHHQPRVRTSHRSTDQAEHLKIDSLRDAVKQQETIGFYNMLVGFMSKAWTTALDDLNVEQPDTMMDQVLAMLWDICEKV